VTGEKYMMCIFVISALDPIFGVVKSGRVRYTDHVVPMRKMTPIMRYRAGWEDNIKMDMTRGYELNSHGPIYSFADISEYINRMLG
jgi:hypothetical protein